MLIEHLGKNAQDRRGVLVDRALGVDVEENRIGGDRRTALQLSEHHRVVKLVLKVADSRFSRNSLIGEKIGQNLQEVRFTASEETRDPYADLVCRLINGVFIVSQERIEMPPQFAGNDILLQLLLDAALVILCDFNNTVYGTVDFFLEDIMNKHAGVLLTAS